MGVPQSPTPPHLYPQALQLKLYQAFIFSIPILFSIILFLLFYLFYLKRRASNIIISSPPLPRPRRFHQTTTTYNVSSACQLDLKVELKNELPIVLFDEQLRKRDSQCCVCLGEFVMKEELLQVPSCKHVFHIDCIHLWLHTNTTCPLCRCSVLPTAQKLGDHPNPPLQPPSISEPPPPQNRAVSGQSQQNIESLEQQQQQQEETSTTTAVITTSSRELQQHITTPIDESSSGTSTNHMDSEPESVVIYIQTHGT